MTRHALRLLIIATGVAAGNAGSWQMSPTTQAIIVVVAALLSLAGAFMPQTWAPTAVGITVIIALATQHIPPTATQLAVSTGALAAHLYLRHLLEGGHTQRAQLLLILTTGTLIAGVLSGFASDDHGTSTWLFLLGVLAAVLTYRSAVHIAPRASKLVTPKRQQD